MVNSSRKTGFGHSAVEFGNKKMGIKIRNYQDNDSNKLEQLLKDTGLYYGTVDKKEVFKDKIEENPGAILVVEDGDKLVGTVFIIYDKWIL